MLCTIAGLDPSGGAGIAADLRTFAAHGGWGTAVLTAVTAQDKGGVHALWAEPPERIRAQLRAALRAAPRALKTGMLATRAALEAIADVLDEVLDGVPQDERPPLVVDPVLAAGRDGTALLEAAALAHLTPRLGPHATLLTPNLPEAAELLERIEIPPGEEREAAEALRARGWRAVLLKGGHGTGSTCRDVLAEPGGSTVFERPRVSPAATNGQGAGLHGTDLHGTGCALSAAITARLAHGETLTVACQAAGDWLHALIEQAVRDGSDRLAPRTRTLPPDGCGR